MEGNDHTYKHPLRFPELLDNKATLLVSKQKRDYIIKAVVEHKIDMGATYHTLIKFIKITDPEVNDLVTLKDLTEQGTMHVYQSELTKCKGQYSVFQPKEIKIENEEFKKYIPKKVNTMTTIYVENPEYKTAAQQEVTSKVFTTGRDYYVISRRDGKLFNYKNVMKKSLKNIMDTCEITSIKPALINKVNAKLMIAPQIDAQFIKNLVIFMNREEPSLPIDVLTSIISQCLYTTVDTETQVTLMKQAGVTGMINDLKTQQVETVPTSLFESLFTGKLSSYLKIQLSDLIFGLGFSKTNQSVNPFQ
jgi:hypothetical protein